ncbi:MAG TPA: AAA family ATPase [Acetobacteraceae bacterium]|nr:AAA family ATPase [Acetobacteraceae bacterium]
MPRLTKLEIIGFRSILHQTVEFGDRTVLIGANGAGKSNLIDFLRMLGFMLGSESGLATFAGLFGPASALFFDGPKQTPTLEAHLWIETSQGTNEYRFRLGYGAGESLIFLEEACRFSSRTRPSHNPRWTTLGAGGHRSPALLHMDATGNQRTQKTILELLRRVQVYQFHDTSRESRLKQEWAVDDNRYLRADAGNIAPFLLRLREEYAAAYRRIAETIRLIAPFLDDFVLEPQNGRVALRWREIGSDFEFGPHQASDGTLRATCLVTLLLQPVETMPPVLVIDEPELGLHPFALHIVAGLLEAASKSHQFILATQSPQVLDEFEADDVVVVERPHRASVFHRRSRIELQRWLDDYALSELWNMNLLGGRPGQAAAE